MASDSQLAGFLGGLVGGAAVAAAVLLRGRGGTAPAATRAIRRLGTDDPRMASVVVHNGMVTISGQVAEIDKLAQSDITAQTQQTLAKVDRLLAQAGSSKSSVIEARIWIKDIGHDFKKMNAVWNAWVDPANKPARFCVESNMARKDILVEVQVVAVVESE